MYTKLDIRKTNKEYALKVIDKQWLNDKNICERLKSEIEAQISLSMCPSTENILRIVHKMEDDSNVSY